MKQNMFIRIGKNRILEVASLRFVYKGKQKKVRAKLVRKFIPLKEDRDG